MYSESSRTVFQKVILCLFAAVAVIFAVWTAVSRTHEGVSFREKLLKVSRQGNTTVYSGKLYGDAVTITSREENGTKYVNFSADGKYYANCRVEYPEGTIRTEYGKEVIRIKVIRNDEVLFSGGYDPDPADNEYLKYYSEDGEWDPLITISAMGNGDPWYYFEFGVNDILRFAGEVETSVRGSLTIYFVALFFSVIGAIVTAFPDELFYLNHFLSVRDPEPTEFYYATHKIGCVLFLVLAFAVYCKGVSMIV